MADENAGMDILTDMNTRLKDLDEKHSLLKEKTLLLGQSFLKQEENITKELAIMKDEMKEMRAEMERMKEGIQHIIHESANFARKEELRLLDKYMKLWEPLKFVKQEEVRKMIDESMKKVKIAVS